MWFLKLCITNSMFYLFKNRLGELSDKHLLPLTRKEMMWSEHPCTLSSCIWCVHLKTIKLLESWHSCQSDSRNFVLRCELILLIIATYSSFLSFRETTLIIWWMFILTVTKRQSCIYEIMLMSSHRFITWVATSMFIRACGTLKSCIIGGPLLPC